MSDSPWDVLASIDFTNPDAERCPLCDQTMKHRSLYKHCKKVHGLTYREARALGWMIELDGFTAFLFERYFANDR